MEMPFRKVLIMRLLQAAFRLLAFLLLFAPLLIADARAEDSAASAKCISIPDDLSRDELIALCTSVIESEKNLPAARLSRVLQARGVGYMRKKDFEKATTDFKKALELLPAGSDENLRQILTVQRDMSVDNKKAEAAVAAANNNNWLIFAVYVAAVCGIWAIIFRTRIGALAYGTAGRISRSDYWFALLAVFAVATVQWLAIASAKRFGVAQLGPIAGPMFFVGWIATILLAATAVSIKRLHDRNRAAWLLIVPIAAVLAALLAEGTLLAAPTDSGPFSGHWQKTFNVIFIPWFAGVTHAGALVTIAVLVIEWQRLVGSGGANLVTALSYLLALAISLGYLREVGILRGTAGANSYGADPLGSASAGRLGTTLPRMSTNALRYAATAVAVIGLATGLYAFAPWHLFSHGPDQANIEAYPDEHCRMARTEMEKNLGLGPNRKSAAETAIRACTIVIRDDTRAAIRAYSYVTRGQAYDILQQREKAIADFKEAVKLKPTGGAACELANRGVSGYECSVGGGGPGLPLPEMH